MCACERYFLFCVPCDCCCYWERGKGKRIRKEQRERKGERGNECGWIGRKGKGSSGKKGGTESKGTGKGRHVRRHKIGDDDVRIWQDLGPWNSYLNRRCSFPTPSPQFSSSQHPSSPLFRYGTPPSPPSPSPLSSLSPLSCLSLSLLLSAHMAAVHSSKSNILTKPFEPHTANRTPSRSNEMWLVPKRGLTSRPQ